MKPELISSLKGYKKSNIVNDLLAGLMVAIIALPLSIALGIQSVPESVSTNGIQFGIITAIVAGFFISALGGSRFQIGGPTAAFVVILYSYLANPDIGILGLALAGIMAGVILILIGICNFAPIQQKK
jgi:SulP family sulfate permease